MSKAQAAASQKRIAAAQAETQRVANLGTCPQCSSTVKRNLSISGWWQCEQYGADTHRARPADAACSWQGFTS